MDVTTTIVEGTASSSVVIVKLYRSDIMYVESVTASSTSLSSSLGAWSALAGTSAVTDASYLVTLSLGDALNTDTNNCLTESVAESVRADVLQTRQ